MKVYGKKRVGKVRESTPRMATEVFREVELAWRDIWSSVGNVNVYLTALKTAEGSEQGRRMGMGWDLDSLEGLVKGTDRLVEKLGHVERGLSAKLGTCNYSLTNPFTLPAPDFFHALD